MKAIFFIILFAFQTYLIYLSISISVMDNEMLACVEGGDIDWGRKISCAAGVAYGAIDGCVTTV
ncbi:bacteriocin BlpO [Streptococcus pneumoniae]|nr:bacteriocin BlpO [Streptococcus pneumoniae]